MQRRAFPGPSMIRRGSLAAPGGARRPPGRLGRTGPWPWRAKARLQAAYNRASRSGDVPGGFSGEGAECGAKKTALAQRRFVVYAASGLPKAVKIAIGVDRLRFISLTEGKAGFGFVAGVQGFKLHALPGL